MQNDHHLMSTSMCQEQLLIVAYVINIENAVWNTCETKTVLIFYVIYAMKYCWWGVIWLLMFQHLSVASCKFQKYQPGVTLCFQFVSAAAAAASSAAPTTFASHIKTVWANPYIFGTKNIWVWGNVLDDPSMTLDQGHTAVTSIIKNLLFCTINWESLIGSLPNMAALLPWSWKLLFWQIFFKKFGCVFSRSNIILAISQEWLVRLMWNEKDVHWLDTGYNMWPWPLTSLMTLTMDVSRTNFEIALSLELLVWLTWNENEVS